MRKFHEIKILFTDDTYLFLEIDGSGYRLAWKNASPRLAKATMAERKHFASSPSGYGLHWPLIDEDLAITPLIDKMERIEPTLARN